MSKYFLCQNKIRAEIRLNDEVKAEIVAVFKPGIKKGYGKPVFESVQELAPRQNFQD
jgi:hypothetical protein